jgi:hypothetical protein
VQADAQTYPRFVCFGGDEREVAKIAQGVPEVLDPWGIDAIVVGYEYLRLHGSDNRQFK